MIKSGVYLFIFYNNPKGEKHPLEHTWANYRVLITSAESNALVCVYACITSVLKLLFSFLHSLLVLSFLLLLCCFRGATGCCLQPSPVACSHRLCSRRMDRNTNTEGQKSQFFAWYLCTFFFSIILGACASQAVSDPQCSACTFIWRGGVVVYYSWVM